jgi:hypothetical protein
MPILSTIPALPSLTTLPNSATSNAQVRHV